MANVTPHITVAEYRRRVGVAPKEGRVKGTKPVVVDGIRIDSTREARRYQDLLAMQAAGQIFELRRQVPFPIALNGVHICDWIADFVYYDDPACDGDARVVEDTKGHKTEVYRLKKKLIESIYGFTILES